jgi:DNA polymerase I-like protein with 3'-5' exonuclease and polymerase domains
VILHVHDEIVIECPERAAEATVDLMREVMCTPSEWAAGLPLGVEIKTQTRYGK